ncbi:hypothetical protein [Amycolatopsis sp. lyj-84]|uniref:hypothetical protein n=1 Tax=Amycolatopsis sp. lyj-84 TaxID=2789284 RepID=UPI00397E2AF1
MDDILLQVIAALSGTLGSVLLGLLGRKFGKRRQDPDLPQAPTLADRIASLQENLSSSSELIDDITAEVHLQAAALERVRAEAEENQRLAALNKEEADAVRAVIESAHAKGAKPNRRQQWSFFLAGLFFSIPLGVGVNFLYDLITA